MGPVNFWDIHNVDERSMDMCKKFIVRIQDTPYRGIFLSGMGEGTLFPEKRYIKRRIVHEFKGNVTYKPTLLKYPNKLLWLIVPEDDGTTYLYRPQLLEKQQCESLYYRGKKMYDITGWSDENILASCHREDGFDSQYYIRNESKKVCGERKTSTSNWSVEFDGKHIMALVIVKEKMTLGEIKMVINNEGGYVDEDGIIHKGTADNKIVRYY